MKTEFVFAGIKNINKSICVTTIKMVKSPSLWNIFFPGGWNELFKGTQIFDIKIQHPLRGGMGWKEKLICLNKNVQLNENDWGQIQSIILFNSPNIYLPVQIPVTRKSKLGGNDYDFSKFKLLPPGKKVKTHVEIIKIKRGFNTNEKIEWEKQPLIETESQDVENIFNKKRMSIHLPQLRQKIHV